MVAWYVSEMVDRAVLERELRERSSEALARMVAVDAEQYTAAALDLAIEVLAERGLTVTRKPAETPDQKRARARGLREENEHGLVLGGGLLILGMGGAALSRQWAFLWVSAILTGLGMLVRNLSRGDGAKDLEAQAKADEEAARAPPPVVAPPPPPEPPPLADDPWAPPRS